MTWTKYFHVGKINFLDSLMYFYDCFALSLFIAVIIFIFVSLWTVIFGTQGTIEGFTLSMMVWYLVMTESLVTSMGKVLEEIGEEVKTGEIAQRLTKPYRYVIFKYAHHLGKALPRFVTTFFLGGLVAYFFVGGFSFSLFSVPFVIVTVVFALTIHFLMMAILGLTALWIEDATGLYLVYQKIVFVAGGMLIPLEVFPPLLQKITVILPFSYIAYHPAKLFVQFSLENIKTVVGGQLIWMALLACLSGVVYQICVKRLSVNGG